MMDNGFRKWLKERIDRAKEAEKIVNQKLKEKENFIREKVIPEIIEFLKEVKAMLEANNFKISLEYGNDWLEFKMFFKNEDYYGIGIKNNFKKREFELVELKKENNSEYVNVLENIDIETWTFSNFKHICQKLIDRFLLAYPLNF